ncbi:amidase [Candidatus Poribacteria bacterium]|nr:amidase [Candidatus Poribacteria bacterium]MBT5534596.1 amidase [Candidatus Poribacteria bacterium]MBT5713960.1 amidase [Candidatus Poribacteria bacterium]MBT7097582.1 amidase [Candidatus Poribacteria bacterium]MBT7807727.1 amidase [Candidatus Poribacteria bacterium]
MIGEGSATLSSLIHRTATDLAGAIRRREASAVETVQAHLAQIERVNGAINAVVTLCAETALDRARDADAALARGEPWGPLHGVPITVKDAFATVGVRATSGHPSLADNVPDYDATPVARLLGAGAILLGKTNMPPFGLNYQCENDLFGRTNNPWDLTRTPGGSSGGSVAAVSSGMVPLELGGDFAGSIRVPAHYSGVFAIKPTEFLASGAGRAKGLPAPPRSVRHMSQPGPIARAAEDVALALRLIAGPDRLAREIPPVPLDEAPVCALSSYSVACMPELPGAKPAGDIAASMTALAAGLSNIGCDVREALPGGWEFAPLMETWAELGYAELGSGMDDASREEFREQLRIAPDSEDALLRGAHRGLDADNRAFAATLTARDRYSESLDRLLEEVDVLLMPTSLTTAIAHWPTGEPIPVDGRDETYWTVGLGYTTPCNLTGHPAVTAPVSLSPDGLPIGVQAVGRRWGDMELLGFVARLTEFVGPLGRPRHH